MILMNCTWQRNGKPAPLTHGTSCCSSEPEPAVEPEPEPEPEPGQISCNIVNMAIVAARRWWWKISVRGLPSDACQTLPHCKISGIGTGKGAPREREGTSENWARLMKLSFRLQPAGVGSLLTRFEWLKLKQLCGKRIECGMKGTRKLQIVCKWCGKNKQRSRARNQAEERCAIKWYLETGNAHGLYIIKNRRRTSL